MKAQYVAFQQSGDPGKAQSSGNADAKCVAKFRKSPCFGVKVHIKIPTLADTIVSNKGRYYGIYYTI